MSCHIAYNMQLLRERAVALATNHTKALYPGSHALLNCGTVRIISPVALAVDVSGTLVADVSLQPRVSVAMGSNAKTKPSRLPIPGCFSSDTFEAQLAPPAPKKRRECYQPLVAANTQQQMEYVLQQTNPRQANYTVFDKITGKRVYHTLPYLKPSDRRFGTNEQQRKGDQWFVGESTLSPTTYVFVLCLCDSQVEDVLAGRVLDRVFEWDLASRRGPFDGRRPRQDDDFLFCKKDDYVVFAVSSMSPNWMKVTKPTAALHVRI